MTKFAAKQLSAVEVGGTSTQHEFHAGRLRKILGFTTRSSGRLTLLIYHASEPLIFECDYTVYDAREGTGRTEWRLYYTTDAIERYARAGDLLVVIRTNNDNHLHAIIAPAGSPIEFEIRNAFSIGDHKVLKTFAKIEPAENESRAAREVSESILDVGTPYGDLASHELYKRALESKAMPAASEMAKAAQALVEKVHGDTLDVDSWLDEVLKAETALFDTIEKGLGQQQLDDLVAAGADFSEIVKFALSKLQSRKTRRGSSLQNHFQALLEKLEIPFTAQCTTENKERPDFIIPSCGAYHDDSFPGDKLRMVGCKAKLRDRWRQYLAEAKRIDIKHHICLDPDLSDEVINNMHAHNLRTCMPRRIINENYANRSCVEKLMKIEDLISELRSVTVGYRPS